MKQPGKLALALVLFAVAAVLVVRALSGGRSNGEDLPQGTFWICRNPECRHTFRMTLRRVLDTRNEDGRVPCPQCGKHLTIRGHQCPHCEGIYPPGDHGAIREVCPLCNRPIPSPLERRQSETAAP